MPTLGELRAIIDNTGKPICDSSGVTICGNCPTLIIPGDCCLYTHGVCIALDPVSGPLDTTGGAPMVMTGYGFLPFGYSPLFHVGAGFTMSGNTVISGQTLCYDVRVLIALRCPDGDPTKVEVKAVAGGGRLNEWSPTCWQSLDYFLVWWWSDTYGYLVLPALEFETPLTTITWDCLSSTPSPITFATTINFYNLADGSLVFAVPQTWNILLKPLAAPCTFTGGVNPCTTYDYAGGVNGRFQEGIWTPSCVWSCPCSGFPDDPSPPPPPTPPDPPHDQFQCCGGRTDFGVEVTATIVGVAAGFPFLPGCDECIDGEMPFLWGPSVGPNGEPGWYGTYFMLPPCRQPPFVNYRLINVRIYCDGINWICDAWFFAPDGSSDVLIETSISVPPCSGTHPDNYFEIALTMNPGTNCASGCPCYGGATIVAGP